MASPILGILDASGRLRNRTQLLHAKVVAGLDVGEGWVNKHVQIWRSYVEKPANKIHENAKRRTQRVDHTVRIIRDTVPHPFRVFKR